MKCNKIDFTGQVGNLNSTMPQIVTSFLLWILAGDEVINNNRGSEISGSASYLCSNLLYHFKTDRQKNYKLSDSEGSNFYKTQRSIHHIALGLAIHTFSRDKKLIQLFQ